MHRIRLMNDGWQFTATEIGVSYENALQEGNWQRVDIPHDFLIADPKNLYKTQTGWYRRVLPVAKKAGERYILRFDGVYQDSTVFVNDMPVMEWKYGYSTFEADITHAVKDGENLLVVRAVHQSPNSRWYSGAGIYRNVYFKTVDAVRFASDGIYVTPVKGDEDWQLIIDSEVLADVPFAAEITHTLLDGEGKKVASCRGETTAEGIFTLTMRGIDARVWDIEDPYLYTLVSELRAENAVHTVSQRIGFRTVLMDAEKGFLLNGRHVKLHGVCLHHDLGALGSAVNREATRRQLQIMQRMGVNALRTSHNMPSVEMMDLCDEMGILVASEAFDMWERPKTTYDYARFFPEWYEKDVAAWVRRDRNRSSVIMWSIGNEIYDTHASERGQEVTRMLKAAVEKNDWRHHAPCTIGSNYMPWEGGQRCADIVKVAGYNYTERLYDDHHAAHPDWYIYGSETFSIVQSRGIYHFPLSTAILADDDLQCSALGNSRTSWGAKTYEKCITDDRDAAFCMGQFIWTGMDYIGEPTPYHTKNSYFGTVDTAGFEKDAFWVFKSGWDHDAAPFVHIYPYWDFNEGQLIDVQVASNAPSVRLSLNGKGMGTQHFDRLHGKEMVAKWQLPYEKGTLLAEGLDAEGNVIASEILSSFGDAEKICLACDKDSLKANGVDMAFITISMQDQDGHSVANANNRVRVKVEGPGRLVGLDNGDSTDYDPWKGTSRRLFSGKLLAMIAATEETGDIAVTVESQGMASETLILPAVAAEKIPGVSCTYRCPESPENREIPIRKLALHCEGGTVLSKERSAFTCTAEIFPKNATYADLSWRVTTPEGIDTNIAAVAYDGHTATVTALGDGMFYLRCMANNGGDHPEIISQMECRAEGLGMASVNPYEFVTGGLYTVSYGDVGTGNERGLCLSDHEESAAGFENVDFGPIGSDEITIPFFTLNDAPYDISLYSGDPYHGGIKIGDFVYQKPSIWNTYQPETYTLNERLKGKHDLFILGHNKMHMKGFVFKKYERAWETVQAADCDTVYGDTFDKRADGVYGIGNNVSLVFDGMNFGKNNGVKLTITGKTALEKNTIHVQFLTADGEQREMAEFTHAPEWQEQTFILPPVPEKCSVVFIFLPGCAFDFKAFRFEKQ
ncbi:MAG: glycoside hydrolase family 2 protein [Clostridia bacterium]|nr:glycoside hydrolase family 2 protein [Clostridia bacterium]